jgi:prophage regulatory protein
MPKQVLIPYRNLKAKGVPYSKPHLWRLERAGKFPKPVPIGPARYAYVEAEVDDYIAALVVARDADQGATNGKTGEKPRAAQRGEKRHAADRP